MELRRVLDARRQLGFDIAYVGDHDARGSRVAP